MKNTETKRERFLRDDLPTQLGNIAANLSRIDSFSDNPDHGRAVEQFIEESGFFVELAAPGAGPEERVELALLAAELERWRSHWTDIWADPDRRAAMASDASAWSRKLLGMAGLAP